MSSTSSSPSVHLVLQRYRSCSILLDEQEWVSVPAMSTKNNGNHQEQQQQVEGDNNFNNANNNNNTHCGLLVYISFASTATKASARQAALYCCQIPVLTSGLWGDGKSRPYSLVQHLQQQKQQQEQQQQQQELSSSPFSLVLVPQANLISKVKSQGKSIQYHGQIDKEHGRQLFHYFVQSIYAIVLDQQFKQQQQHQHQQQFPALNRNYARLQQWIQQQQAEQQAEQTTTTSSRSSSSTGSGTGTSVQQQGQQPQHEDPIASLPSHFPLSTPPHEIYVPFVASQLFPNLDPDTGLPTHVRLLANNDKNNINSEEEENKNITTTAGIPMEKEATVVPLAKNAIKRLRKLQQIHATKHDKWKKKKQQEQQDGTNNNNNNKTESSRRVVAVASSSIAAPTGEQSHAIKTTTTMMPSTCPTTKSQSTATVTSTSSEETNNQPSPSLVPSATNETTNAPDTTTTKTNIDKDNNTDNDNNNKNNNIDGDNNTDTDNDKNNKNNKNNNIDRDNNTDNDKNNNIDNNDHNDHNDEMTLTWMKEALDPSFCQIVAGSFGKRQGLALYSDMGPFCHTVQV